MTRISAKIECNFFIEIKSDLFCVCVRVLCCLSGSAVLGSFLSHYYLDPDIDVIAETLA